MNILTFSASPRKLWVDEFKRILNPSYWLLGRLLVEHAKHHSVYTLPISMNPIGRIRPYKGQHLDQIIITGVAYSPSNCGSSFNKGFMQHQRAFDISTLLKPILKRFPNIPILLLTVDVRGWYDDAQACFNFTPTHTLTEQDVGWAKVGYFMTNKIYEQQNQQNQTPTKFNQICFTGNAKKREDKLLYYMQPLSAHLPVHIDGGGYKALKLPRQQDPSYPNIYYNGMRMFNDSVQLMLSSKYALVMHEPIGEDAGWITAKFFENLGTKTISFVDSEYDKFYNVIPKDHVLRVSGPAEMLYKILNVGYNTLLAEQNKLIDPAWSSLDYYYKPLQTYIKENL